MSVWEWAAAGFVAWCLLVVTVVAWVRAATRDDEEITPPGRLNE